MTRLLIVLGLTALGFTAAPPARACDEYCEEYVEHLEERAEERAYAREEAMEEGEVYAAPARHAAPGDAVGSQGQRREAIKPHRRRRRGCGAQDVADLELQERGRDGRRLQAILTRHRHDADGTLQVGGRFARRKIPCRPRRLG